MSPRVPPFADGYVAVELFFVISGYLISRIVLADVERGRFSMAQGLWQAWR